MKHEGSLWELTSVIHIILQSCFVWWHSMLLVLMAVVVSYEFCKYFCKLFLRIYSKWQRGQQGHIYRTGGFAMLHPLSWLLEWPDEYANFVRLVLKEKKTTWHVCRIFWSPLGGLVSWGQIDKYSGCSLLALKPAENDWAFPPKIPKCYK